jgi:hypothetical protein
MIQTYVETIRNGQSVLLPMRDDGHYVTNTREVKSNFVKQHTAMATEPRVLDLPEMAFNNDGQTYAGQAPVSGTGPHALGLPEMKFDAPKGSNPTPAAPGSPSRFLDLPTMNFDEK